MALPVSYRLKLTLFLLAFNIIGGFADGYLLAASPFAADPLIKDQPKRLTSRAKAVWSPGLNWRSFKSPVGRGRFAANGIPPDTRIVGSRSMCNQSRSFSISYSD